MKIAVGLLLAVLVASGCGGDVPEPSPGTAPAFECLGVPDATCEQILRDTAGDKPVAGARIRCTAATCSEAQGEVSIEIIYADGTRSQSGLGWMSAPGVGAPEPAPVEPPTLPVKPECLGIEEDTCLERAAEALTGLGLDPAIASITVRCLAVCTPASGTGETVIVRADGTSQETQWEYEGR